MLSERNLWFWFFELFYAITFPLMTNVLERKQQVSEADVQWIP